MLYHMVMARKQVLVQLEDELIAQLDRIAQERGINRSDLLRRLVRNLVEAEDDRQADVQHRAAYQAIPEDPLETEWLTRLAAQNAIEW